MERRDFLKKAVKAVFAFFVLVVVSALAYVYPFRIRKPSLRFFYLADEDDLPRRGVRRMDFRYVLGEREVVTRVYAVATEKGVTVFSPICTHLGCFVNWDSRKKEFICPCHAGRYSVDGKVIGGPPPRPLTELPLSIVDGKAYLGVKV
ncbi:MAG: ubiquinol-cytochrome c reductase iron-sulfur subunit [Chloroflexota bacterium]